MPFVSNLQAMAVNKIDKIRDDNKGKYSTFLLRKLPVSRRCPSRTQDGVQVLSLMFTYVNTHRKYHHYHSNMCSDIGNQTLRCPRMIKNIELFSSPT